LEASILHSVDRTNHLLIGSRIVQFALVWWLTKLTGSAQLNAAGVLAREKDFDMTYVRSDTQRHESHGFYHQ